MRWPAPQPQLVARVEMFVKATDSITGLLHHIGNADAFETLTRVPRWILRKATY
jgi:hypothetical protein